MPDIEVNLCTSSAEGEDDIKATPKEILNIVDRHERKSQPNVNSPLELNLGTGSDPKIVFVGPKLKRDLKNQMIVLLIEFKDVFAWSYEDMSGLNTNIVAHHLPLKPDAGRYSYETRMDHENQRRSCQATQRRVPRSHGLPRVVSQYRANA